MAAYAALVSVMQILDQLERHPFPPISIDRQQLQSLTESLTFLQEFLEEHHDSPVDEAADPLEMRIADAAYAAEDVIESYIVDTIHLRRSTSSPHHPSCSTSFFNCFRGSNKEATSHGGASSGEEFCQDLQKVIGELDLIKKTVMETAMKEKSSAGAVRAHQPLRNISVSGKSSTLIMVGFDDVMLQLLDKLTGGSLYRQVIPITGMGGIGKTTLARSLFQSALVKEYFDICAWVTISQTYNTKEILCQILSRQMSSDEGEGELGEDLHKYLYGRRYLIVLDDMWSIDAWEKIQLYLGDCNNGSRIIVTTRQSYLTSLLTDPNNDHAMEFLDEVSSWNLFSKTVFGEERFPLQLEKVGKKIVEKCRGLPLSIVVIGGLLAKSQQTQQHWEHIEAKLNSILNLENDEFCLKILKLSYNHLPAYLKPSFLYMGVFEEDTRIRVSTLIKLWVSEGFLKPENGKSLETIGKAFLNELIDRNLILVDELGSITENIKYCKMHDLLRDLCLKEAEKERFYHVIGQHSTTPHNCRRMFYPPQRSSKTKAALKSMSHVRSYTCQYHRVGKFRNFKLLRILNALDSNDLLLLPEPEYSLKDVIHELVNSRYVAICTTRAKTKLPSSLNFLWNLHTLRIEVAERVTVLPVEIWKMYQLRHVEFTLKGMSLPDPPSDSSVILENLQTLKGVVNFKCGEEVVKRIPNIMKLEIDYNDDKSTETGRHDYCLNNVERLRKLESFSMIWLSRSDDEYVQRLTFPHSLKNLTLVDHHSLEEMLGKIGSLPLLEKLQLRGGFFTTHKWETVEGQFPSLKSLQVSNCRGLEKWLVEESSHFPLLEHIHLFALHELEEVPAEIGEIPTLKSIVLESCCESVVKSLKKIVEEQEELQGEDQLDFHVRVLLYNKKQEALQSLASPNFKVEASYFLRFHFSSEFLFIISFKLNL